MTWSFLLVKLCDMLFGLPQHGTAHPMQLPILGHTFPFSWNTHPLSLANSYLLLKPQLWPHLGWKDFSGPLCSRLCSQKDTLRSFMITEEFGREQPPSNCWVNKWIKKEKNEWGIEKSRNSIKYLFNKCIWFEMGNLLPHIDEKSKGELNGWMDG